jgi:predicted ATP-dependent endonuclease of OLD family
MKLEKLKVKNFGKFIDEIEINLGGDIATIIGENGTGKSSALFIIKLLFDRKIRRSGISVG